MRHSFYSIKIKITVYWNLLIIFRYYLTYNGDTFEMQLDLINNPLLSNEMIN